MRSVVLFAALAWLIACSPKPAPGAESESTATSPAPAPGAGLPAGAYRLDPSHASLLFTVDHLGFSKYAARFSRFDAELTLDPANPSTATLVAHIDPESLALDNPPAGFLDELLGPQWLGAAQYPEMTFRSRAVAMTGANTADVAGDLTFHGLTKPVTLHVTFNGGWAGIPEDPHARIGFSAHGELKRSDFGVDFGVPPPGSRMGVSDEVRFAIEAEFTGPPLQDSPASH